MAERARVGVVGTGFIGPVHVEALRRIGAEVVGLVGSSPEAARRKGEEIGVQAYDSLDDLLDVPELTSVHITTPNYLHAPDGRAGPCRRQTRRL